MHTRVKHISDFAAPNGRRRWVIQLEVAAGRWFEVNVLDDITTPELEALFVAAQESIADRQAAAALVVTTEKTEPVKGNT